jgi:hypothetical protein
MEDAAPTKHDTEPPAAPLRCEGESEAAYRAFVYYYEMEPPRTLYGAALIAEADGLVSISEANRKRRMPPSMWRRWAKKCDWKGRVAALEVDKEKQKRSQKARQIAGKIARLQEDLGILRELERERDQSEARGREEILRVRRAKDNHFFREHPRHEREQGQLIDRGPDWLYRPPGA